MTQDHLTPSETLTHIKSFQTSRIIRTAIDKHQGHILNGKYRLSNVISKGGMGDVYMARCVETGTLFAIKVLRSDLSLVERVRERFLLESRAAARIHHPAVVHAREVGETSSGELFIVMEYVRGPTLRHFLNTKKLDLAQTLLITGATAEGLNAAHEEGVIHRDLKPENILIPRSSHVGSVVKIVDFGIARLLDTPRITTTTHILGTPSYISPEQATNGPIDRRADVYSLGVIMYEMLSSMLPFQGNTPEELLESHIKRNPTALRKYLSYPIPIALESLVMGCLEKSPQNRPESMDEIIAVIATL